MYVYEKNRKEKCCKKIKMLLITAHNKIITK